MSSPKEDIYTIPFKVQGAAQKGEKYLGSGRQQEGLEKPSFGQQPTVAIMVKHRMQLIAMGLPKNGSLLVDELLARDRVYKSGSHCLRLSTPGSPPGFSE